MCVKMLMMVEKGRAFDYIKTIYFDGNDNIGAIVLGQQYSFCGYDKKLSTSNVLCTTWAVIVKQTGEAVLSMYGMVWSKI